MTNIKKIEISGYKGFSSLQKIELGIPNNTDGSGLTILVGPNNGGKSTIVESFRVFANKNSPSLSEGMRNSATNKFVSIKFWNTNNEFEEIKNIQSGGSETERIKSVEEFKPEKFYVLPSRRMFSPFFYKLDYDKEIYLNELHKRFKRSDPIDYFSERLFNIQKNRDKFDKILEKVLSPLPNWRIELSDNGQYYVQFIYKDQYHNSDGIGEGIISLFYIIDSLYESSPDEVIIIDEPELSLHPALQKKLANLFAEYSKNRQILIATHSPHFIDWKWLSNGAKLIRVIREENGISTYLLQAETTKIIKNLTEDIHNPHVLGSDAKEAFFLENNIILVEGQEDVIIYQKIMREMSINISAEFYGWGSGGAEKMIYISQILDDLGFKKVVGILDNNPNSKHLLEKLSKFKTYKYIEIPTEDVRDKNYREVKKEIHGLTDKKGNIHDNYKKDIKQIFQEIENYF